MVGPKKQAFCPKSNMLKGNFDTNYFELERTEGDIERRGPLPCPRPRRRGGGRGELLTILRGHSGDVVAMK